MAEPFSAGREARWYYASECIEHVEEHNCAKGCQHGLTDPRAFAVSGPGGSCGVLAAILCEEPTEDLWDDGEIVHCRRFLPLEVTDG